MIMHFDITGKTIPQGFFPDSRAKVPADPFFTFPAGAGCRCKTDPKKRQAVLR
jgi:hypothetical protein